MVGRPPNIATYMLDQTNIDENTIVQKSMNGLLDINDFISLNNT